MLSSLAYTQVQTFLRARAFDAGIEVYEVNPAYTSVIGRYKFSGRYGMSAHNAAALVIGDMIWPAMQGAPTPDS